eukprot:CAMPEP_0172533396 /NCGR_PEP_ID=MMETSP1067-20121228/6122_1 /TAXON_ID=265564 ORGANISM="Thalassiosira punctigera, Strain Tpunct2005C2" /NCGR_SAMPLE_ID=MMETSP1067 /ASSEMBLY_ACC=CAM_ASM_000444 /LENGTH=415 /DNA_ID=CAMNT_0013318041 /DNA_START=31 /DNA_END=1278 /DNA_ORIENTATION=-
MHYEESSQATKWQLSSQAELNSLRERSNRRAREVLSTCGDNFESVPADAGGGDVKMEDVSKEGGDSQKNMTNNPCEVYGFAETRGDPPKATDLGDDIIDSQQLMQESDPNYGPNRTSKTRGNHPLLTPGDESAFVTFYCSKIPSLIAICRRSAKVAATACLLFRRFYLSNSVMMHDPKTMLAAAAFLATKVEDCSVTVRCLEKGTKEMSAPVLMNDILDAEVKFIKGIDFDLLVFSPYKTVLACTEDLRTFLKSDKGRGLITFSGQDGEDRQLAGEDLRPIHDAAMEICDDVIVSDIPLLFAPGEVGLAALMIANECVSGSGDEASSSVDIMGYVRSRFQGTVDAASVDAVTCRVSKLSEMIRELKEGKYGCGNYKVDMDTLKGLNKKLKKCRAWGSPDKNESKKKKKKRKTEDS